MDSRWGRWVLEFLSRRVLGRTGSRRGRHRQVNRLEDRTLLAAFAVNTLLDTVDANPGDGLALDANGNTSLRAAVMEANALAGADTITLEQGAYLFSRPDTENGEFFSVSGDLDIISDITIEGAGAAQSTIDANLLDRAFDITGTGRLTLRGVTVTRGQADAGGAIRNGGFARLENSVLTGNRATVRGGAVEQSSLLTALEVVSSQINNNRADVGSPTGATTGIGGGLYLSAGTASIIGSQLDGNLAATEGGAINVRNMSLTITNSTFSNNTANYGGAIRMLAGTVTINDSTFTGNTAQFGGGAIKTTGGGTLTINRGDFENNRTTYFANWNSSLNGGALSLNSSTTVNGTEFRNNSSWRGGAIYAFSAGVTVLNSLFEGNDAFKTLTPGLDSNGAGGAIMVDTNAVLTSTNNTLVGNRSTGAGAIYVGSTTRIVNNTITGNLSWVGEFGGDSAVDGSGSLYLANSIIAGNTGIFPGEYPDIGRSVSSGGGNLIGNYIGTNWAARGYLTTDMMGTPSAPLDPQLLPLAENGGPTRTMAIPSTSLARDFGGVTSFVLSTDARGVARSGLRPDAGAYEYQNQAPTALVFTGGVTKHDQPLTGQLQGTDPDGDTLTFSAPYGPSIGTMVIQPNGQFTYTPPANIPNGGRVLFDFRVTDGHGGTSTLVRSEIQLLPNLAPTSTKVEGVGIEDVVFTGQLLATDPDGNSMTFEVGSSFGGTVSTLPNGQFTFTPNLNFTGTASFWSRARDQYGAYSAWVLNTITLAPVNDAPIVPDQVFVIDEGLLAGGFVGNVQWQDDGPFPIRWTFSSGNDDLRLLLQGGGSTISIGNPEAFDFETQPVQNFVLKVWDAEGLTTYANYTIVLRDVQVPKAAYRYISTPEHRPNGTVLTTVSLETLPDAGQSVLYSIDFDPTGGAFTIDPVTGVLTVANSSLLNYETNTAPIQYLKIRTTDAANPSLSAVADLGFAITNLDETPVMAEQSFAVNENTLNDELVGQIVATDEDLGQTLTFSLVSSTLPGLFAVNPATGAIRVNNSLLLNYEQVQSVTLTVSVQDNGTPNLSTTRDIVISINDVNEPPVLDSQSFAVDEDAQDLQFVGNILFTDPDLGQTHEVRLTGTNLPGALSVDSDGGIRVADRALLDYETLDVITLIVEVQDSGTPGWVTTSTMFVYLNDRNDAPVIADQTYSISENPLAGARVAFVQASDPDAGQSLTYTIASSSLPGAFVINPTTGEVTVADSSLLDFEAVTSATLVVTATDNGNPALSSSATVTVAITDANERPTIADQNFTVAENAAAGAVVGTVVSSDVDAGQIRTYAITSSAPIAGAFAIDSVSGEITVADGSLLDYEAISAVALTVTVTDDGNPALSSSAVVVVTLTDVNEAPTIANQSFSIAENTLNSNRVGFATGSDVDAGQSLTYAIASSSLPGAFAINPATGEVTVADSSLLDFETLTIATLVVTATDSGNPALSSNATVTVVITDINERPTIVGQNFTVTENSANGTVVGTVVSSDVDAGQTRTYAITASAPISGAFVIDAVTGVITVADGTMLNFETLSAIALTVTVTDSGNPALSSSAVVVVTLSDVNEAPAIANQSFSVAENSANGTVVGNIAASDIDAGQTLTYTITGTSLAGAFAIDAATGRITVANSALLNFETVSSVTLTVRVADSGNPALSSSATVTISLTNVNDAPTIANQTFSIAENSTNGTIVGNVAASDADAGQSLSYSIVSGNTGGAFAINAATGRITVANVTALNFETTPTFALVVRVTDNGNPALSSTATMTINLSDVIEAIVIGLDVVPGDPANSVKLSGKFDIAILSTANFDARTVNVSTIRFGKNGTEDSITRDKRGNRVYSYRDVNGDGRLDLVVNITTSKTGLGLSNTLAKVSGLTTGGQQILGSSSIIVRR